MFLLIYCYYENVERDLMLCFDSVIRVHLADSFYFIYLFIYLLLCLEYNSIFQLEGTFKDHLDQLPDYFSASQKNEKCINKGIIQMPPEWWPTDGIKCPSRKLVPVFDPSLLKVMFLNIVFELPLVQHCAVTMWLVKCEQIEETGTSICTWRE